MSTVNKRLDLSDADMNKVIELLADNGISVGSAGNLKQNSSIVLYPNGTFTDFGSDNHDGDVRDNLWYGDVEHLLRLRPSLIDAPVQASKYTAKTGRNTDEDKSQVIKAHLELKDTLEEFYELEESSLMSLLDEFLPPDWFRNGFPDSMGYKAYEPKTLTVSALDVDGKAQAVCYRRAMYNGKEIRWKTNGAKIFIPSKLTDKDKVYLASGMGELVMLELLGVDYIVLQSDGMANHLSKPKEEIQHLIILPDNDDAFMKRVPDILTALNPKKASIVKWEHSDPREAAQALKTMDVFMSEVSKCLEEIDVPEPTDVSDASEIITEYDKSTAPKLVLSFEKHWEDVLGNISSPALLQNWDNNFEAFDEITDRNINSKPSKKICCPSPTGSGKTQQIIHKAIDLHGSGVRTLIVTMRTEDADIIASQIKTYTHDDYVGVFHSKEVSIAGVRKVDHPREAQCLVITHERFRRQEKSITALRDFIVVDEAIDVISHTSITDDDLLSMIRLVEKAGSFKYENKDTKQLESEFRMLKQIYDIQFKAFIDSGSAFIGLRAGAVPPELTKLPSLQFTEVIKFMGNKKLKPSTALTGISNKKMDDALKAKYIKISETIMYFFSQFNFMTRSGANIAWHTASELIPGKSIVVMDATASVNKAYDLYMMYQPETLEVLLPIQCRNYSNVILNQVRTNTGRYTILGENEISGDDEGVVSDKVRKFISNVERNSEVGDDILIVSFKEMEASLMTYSESLDGRTVHVDHFGNLTGTNKYQHCNRIFIYGLNHKPEDKHRSMHALIKSPAESFKDSEENDIEMKMLITSDMVAETIQAINRIKCRRVIDDKGNCDEAHVYLTLPARFEESQIMLSSITSEMHGIKIKDWDISKEDGVKLARVFSVEAFMTQLDAMLSNTNLEVSLDAVLEALNMTREQYRLNIKGKKSFENALDASPFFSETRQRIGYRGKAMKSKEQWFVLGVQGM